VSTFAQTSSGLIC